MKNQKRKNCNWIFIFWCIAWGLFVTGVLIFFLNPNPNEENKIKKPKVEVATIETKEVYRASAYSMPSESIPFFEISESDRYIIKCVVAGESKGESFKGKKLVAQCIMNAMIRNDWDAETVRVEYQYSGWDSDLENSNPKIWSEVELAVSEVFDEGNLETYESILYFYAPEYSSGSWHENNLEYVLTEGGHKFFKLKGE